MSNNLESEVLKVVQTYIDATYKADVDALRGTFHREARMSGYLGDQLLVGTPEPFICDIASQPSMESVGANYHAAIVYLSVTGKIAEAIVREDEFRGAASLENHFHLIFDGGVWSIISKTFTTL
ncbi:MAG: nuclear transport factor 2 family protein [Clostridiales bacterium]|jgi:hypothetical protein|nr:nuclear transport factor 2 family protein [Clostridiales bacterium]